MKGLFVALVIAGSGCGASDAEPLCDGCVLFDGSPRGNFFAGLAIDRQDRIVVAELGLSAPVVKRISKDVPGAIDEAFGAAPVPGLIEVSAVIAMADGSIRVGGKADQSGNPVVFGFSADGRDDGLRIVGTAEAADEPAIHLMEQDGALVVGHAHSRSYEGHLVRYKPGGMRDAAFPPAPTEWATAITPSGQFVMAGAYRAGETRGFLARRLTRDGAPDPSFGGGTAVVIPGVDRDTFGFISVAPSAAGGLILAGVANPAQPALMVARFDAAGQLDPSFGGGSGFVIHDVLGTGGVVRLVEAADRGIVVVGAFGADRTNSPMAIRLAPDGSLDPAFGDGGVLVLDAKGGFASVAAMASGEIIAVGQADQRPLLARFPAP